MGKPLNYEDINNPQETRKDSAVAKPQVKTNFTNKDANKIADFFAGKVDSKLDEGTDWTWDGSNDKPTLASLLILKGATSINFADGTSITGKVRVVTDNTGPVEIIGIYSVTDDETFGILTLTPANNGTTFTKAQKDRILDTKLDVIKQYRTLELNGTDELSVSVTGGDPNSNTNSSLEFNKTFETGDFVSWFIAGKGTFNGVITRDTSNQTSPAEAFGTLIDPAGDISQGKLTVAQAGTLTTKFVESKIKYYKDQEITFSTKQTGNGFADTNLFELVPAEVIVASGTLTGFAPSPAANRVIGNAKQEKGNYRMAVSFDTAFTDISSVSSLYGIDDNSSPKTISCLTLASQQDKSAGPASFNDTSSFLWSTAGDIVWESSIGLEKNEFWKLVKVNHNLDKFVYRAKRNIKESEI